MMKYDIHFRHGGKITVESKRTLDEISDFLTRTVNGDNPATIWGVLANGDEPSALVSVLDVIAVVPALEPARVRDREGDTWQEIIPGEGMYVCVSAPSMEPRTLAAIEEDFAPVEVLTS